MPSLTSEGAVLAETAKKVALWQDRTADLRMSSLSEVIAVYETGAIAN